MPSLREFFMTEANEILARLNGLVQRLDEGAGEVTELQRDVRALRGSAQMAREDRAYRTALGLEAAIRALLTGVLKWNEEVSARIRRSLEDIASLAEGSEADDDADSRVRRSLDRWREIGVPLAEDVDNSLPSSEASRQFMQFAAHEVAGVVTEMDVGLEMLTVDPRNRDPLKSILRRERALLGAARLDEITVVAEVLRATDDMARLIAKLNAPVKEEWLAVFRSAREVLKTSLDALQKGELPTPTPALSRLRVLRQELTERHGEVDALAQPHQRAGAPQAVSSDDIVPIEQLCYSGERALQRALELKPEVERLAAANPAARDTIEEVFDLIRLGIN
jgi:chemotaxis protein histidine kinase CheA